MPTVINNPGGSSDGGGSGLVVGVFLAIIILGAAVLFFVYGLPMINGNADKNDGNIDVNFKLPESQNNQEQPQ